MATDGEGLRFTIDFDPRALRADLIELERLSQSFGNTLVRAFASAIVGGRKLSDVLRSLALSLSRQALTGALRPLGNLLGEAFAGVLANAKGGAFAAGRIKPFARGGIVGGPTLFALRGGAGLMGEAGPEAVLPLARGADGRLGVRAEAARSVTVNLNITTPDVEGFRRSGSQVAAMMLRALERGQRNL
jgi:phage-related minor tail protein